MPTSSPTRASAPARAASSRTLPFEIRRSAIQGRGAFAVRRIRAGQRIIEYTGERIPHAEGDRRYQEDGMHRHHTFLFTLDDETVIDGKRGGNESRYINHSCAPNCEAVIEDGEIWIYARENIQPGSELTYDYQYERTEAHTAEDERFYACRCGAPTCRGSILAPPKRTRRRAGADPARKAAGGGARDATTPAAERPTRAKRPATGATRTAGKGATKTAAKGAAKTAAKRAKKAAAKGAPRSGATRGTKGAGKRATPTRSGQA